LHASGGDDGPHRRPLHLVRSTSFRALQKNGIEQLADVSFPGSRTNPQFDANSFNNHCTRPELQSMSRVGGRRRAAKDSKTRLAEHVVRAADHMPPASGRARVSLIAHAQEKTTAIMPRRCRRCHRFLIADALTDAGWRVLHITGSAATSHKFTPFLRGEATS
jgi:uncharacterized protein (DUF488 family)